MTLPHACPEKKLFVIRNIAAAAILTGVIITSVQAATPQSDVNTILARAEVAYYEARFSDTIAMLVPLNASLEGQPGRVTELVRTKLQLALAYIGLNLLPEAKMLFSELYELDPQFSLDEAKFTRKVLALFEEAKAARDERKCREICDRANGLANAPNAFATADPLATKSLATRTCSCMPAKNINAADSSYEEAVQAYKRGELPEALAKIHSVLALNPTHRLATEYLALIDNRLRLSIEQATLDWYTQFRAGDFVHAAESYRQLLSTNLEERAAAALDQVRSEYRKAIAEMGKSWTQACEAQDHVTMDSIRREANELLPETSIAQDILGQMNNCAAKPIPGLQPAAAMQSQPALSQGCLENSSSVALIRLKSRVEPRLPVELRGKRNLRVQVTVKIDEGGNTRVYQVHGGSMPVTRAVVAAVDQWKFYPATYNDRSTCVETELPLVLNRK